MTQRCCPTDKGPAKCPYTPQGGQYYLTGPLDSKKGILLVSDIFGLHPNACRYADVLAKAGFLVLMPDFFGPRVWPADNWPPNFESEEWKSFWGFCSDFEKTHLPIGRNGVAVLRKLGCTKIASMGMCWGSRIAFDLAAEKLVEAAGTSHPSILSADSVKAAKTPLLIMHSKQEPPYEDVEAVVKASPFKINVYERYNHLEHGFFGARFDYDDATPEEQKEIKDATEKSLKFFQAALQ